jgi:transcriptional antiterminator
LNYFKNTLSNEISYETLRNFRKEIEQKLDNTVYVDITQSSIREAVYSHFDNIKMELTSVKLKGEREEFFNVIGDFNAKIPIGIKESYLGVFSDLNDE